MWARSGQELRRRRGWPDSRPPPPGRARRLGPCSDAAPQRAQVRSGRPSGRSAACRCSSGAGSTSSRQERDCTGKRQARDDGTFESKPRVLTHGQCGRMPQPRVSLPGHCGRLGLSWGLQSGWEHPGLSHGMTLPPVIVRCPLRSEGTPAEEHLCPHLSSEGEGLRAAEMSPRTGSGRGPQLRPEGPRPTHGGRKCYNCLETLLFF